MWEGLQQEVVPPERVEERVKSFVTVTVMLGLEEEKRSIVVVESGNWVQVGVRKLWEEEGRCMWRWRMDIADFSCRGPRGWISTRK